MYSAVPLGSPEASSRTVTVNVPVPVGAPPRLNTMLARSYPPYCFRCRRAGRNHLHRHPEYPNCLARCWTQGWSAPGRLRTRQAGRPRLGATRPPGAAPPRATMTCPPAGRTRVLWKCRRTRPRRAGRIQGAGGGLAGTRYLIGESGVRRRFCAGARALRARCPACDMPSQDARWMSSPFPSSSSLFLIPCRCGRTQAAVRALRSEALDSLALSACPRTGQGVRAWSTSRFCSR